MSKNLFKKIFSFSNQQQISPNIPSPKNPLSEQILNITLLGSSNAGKSTFLHKYLKNEFQNSQSTHKVIYTSKTIQLQSLSIQLRIWDINGQENQRSNISSCLTKDQFPHVCLIFYDIGDRKSFEQVQFFYETWAQKLGEAKEKSSLFLVANKIDLRYTGAEEVSIQEGLNKAKKLAAVFIQSSSLFDVSPVFLKILQLMLPKFGYRVTNTAKTNSQRPQSQNIPKQMKNKLISYLLTLEKLNKAHICCDFQKLFGSYLKKLQLKSTFEKKFTNLKTIQQSVNKLESICKGDNNSLSKSKNLQILRHMKDQALQEVKRVQKQIVASLNQKYQRIEELEDASKAFEEYKQLQKQLTLLEQSPLSELGLQKKVFESFLQSLFSYTNQLNEIAADLLQIISKDYQKETIEADDEELISNLVNSLIETQAEKETIKNEDQQMMRTKSQTNDGNSLKQSSQELDKIRSQFKIYQNRARKVIENLIRNPEDRQIEKQILEYNTKFAGKSCKI